MVFWLTSRPGWVLVLFLFIFTGLAMMGPYLVRLRVRLVHLRGNNEVAGFKFAVIGVLYAVLLAFVVIISWERYHDAEKALATEAGSAATLYRLAGGLDESNAATFRVNLSAYLNSVLADDWPAMVRGRSSAVTTPSLKRRASPLYVVRRRSSSPRPPRTSPTPSHSRPTRSSCGPREACRTVSDTLFGTSTASVARPWSRAIPRGSTSRGRRRVK